MSETAPVRLVPLVQVMLDKPRSLLLTLEAMIKFEEETGISMLSNDTKWLDKMGAGTLRAFLWACLRHEDPTLTLEDVGRMVHVGNLNDVCEKLGEAFKQAMPAKRAVEPARPPKRRA